MKTGKRYTVPFRRVREGKTNYKRRLNLLKGGKTRIVVRKSLKHIIIQAVDYHPAGDKVLATVKSDELKKLGWKHSTGNTPAAYLTGLLAAKKISGLGREEFILDIGIHTPVKGSRIFAALKGLVEGGLNIPHDESVLPDDERTSGNHIASFRKEAQSIANDVEELKKKISTI
ncbi:50S ribosomal protein L18 [Candidatus Woesearchaeota archaeon]|nr:MAG: 50S ribosomal protein L18 [Candidatus Woesearchaeota archaeon]